MSELKRLLEAAEAADRALWEHLETLYEAWHVDTDDDLRDTETASWPTREWRERRDELREAAKRAHDEWLNYEPRRRR